jgi:uncharacterized protein
MEYMSLICDILDNKSFRRLAEYHQHLGTSRLQHSIHVSYLAWKLARLCSADEVCAARAGLLHDFCLYDFHAPDKHCEFIKHPFKAAENTQRHFFISEKEYAAIVSHMFPAGPMPTSAAGWLITIADKICAVQEFWTGFVTLLRSNVYLHQIQEVSAAA